MFTIKSSLVTLLAVASFATAQNSTSQLDPQSVDLTTKNQWCNAQKTSCPLLCGGPMATKTNLCTGSDLSFTCLCQNGTSPPDLDQYDQTIPSFECNRLFQQCNRANPGSQTCRQQTCGTLKPDTAPAATTSSAAMDSASASTSGGAGPTESVMSASSSGAGVGSMPMPTGWIGEMAVGVGVVGGMMALL